MKVHFWGTRGSIATPGAGTTYFGGNTSCVQLTTNDGDLLICDCGTGARQLAGALMGQGNTAIHSNILLGHTHWDHIQGFPFFTPAFIKGNTVAIYGPEGSRAPLHDVLAGQMEFTYFPIDLNQLPATITYHDLTEGVYAMMPGPHYETPAEITMLGRLGADLVGMSTVLEAIAARHLGAEVLGISLVTNLAAGLAGQSLSHAEVVEAGRASANRMGSLLAGILPRV